jgi:hypothetical protein
VCSRGKSENERSSLGLTVFGQSGAVAELLSDDWAESGGGGKEQCPLDNFKKSLHRNRFHASVTVPCTR